jgi:hypothetical protein
MHGLAKIHKPGDKMRPIISNINSAFQNLSTWLVNELRQLKPVTEMYVKNFTEFCQQLKDVTLQRNEALVSFDVISLFPIVPVAAAIENMQQWFQEMHCLQFWRTFLCFGFATLMMFLLFLIPERLKVYLSY